MTVFYCRRHEYNMYISDTSPIFPSQLYVFSFKANYITVYIHISGQQVNITHTHTHTHTHTRAHTHTHIYIYIYVYIYIYIYYTYIIYIYVHEKYSFRQDLNYMLI